MTKGTSIAVLTPITDDDIICTIEESDLKGKDKLTPDEETIY